ncbi:ribokinase [Sulfitobacter guttiformis]|uniref:Ribokinase n=1 Tax=Sulfitobacter guttiformis TaxID=74349 RepID=A0A420DS78_9RHOB|nr:ribokinase [Sulfitobacter guttiformis]KIN74415.1 Ribokinase [Sulfitobacter guttiformis KCTC 32187]RKE97013.1 ribokinase [Sulfitobacter guttiformis]
MIWNLGSINIDNFYEVPHLPAPGETLAAVSYGFGLGGKGANMSVAAARGAARVSHIGAIGADGRWTRDRLMEYGVDTPHIAQIEAPTGHANILIDPQGENSIVLFQGANVQLTEAIIGTALAEASHKDFLLMQNETNGQEYAAITAQSLGLRVVYAAAPFDSFAIERLLGRIDLLVLNEVEAAQLLEATGQSVEALGVADVIITLGAQGCRWVSNAGIKQFDAYHVEAVDTTGAGDTFTGYLVAGLDRGMDMAAAIDLALMAAALMVTRRGTADVIPDLKEIQDEFGT